MELEFYESNGWEGNLMFVQRRTHTAINVASWMDNFIQACDLIIDKKGKAHLERREFITSTALYEMEDKEVGIRWGVEDGACA